MRAKRRSEPIPSRDRIEAPPAAVGNRSRRTGPVDQALAGIRGLKATFKPGYLYAKAGVRLLDLQDSSVEQCELALDDPGEDRSQLMTALDAINGKHVRGSVALTSADQAGERRW